MISKRFINILLMFFAFSFIALSCADKAASLEEPFSVTVYDSDYSMGYAIIYHLDKNNIQVAFSGGLEGETDSVVYKKQLSLLEKEKMAKFFSDFPIADLEEKYINPNIADGEKKIFDFRIGKLEKQIQESNYYQEDLAALVDFINALVSEEYKMRYEDYQY